MYIGSLPQISNRATYIQDVEIVNDDTDEGFDLSHAVEIEIQISQQQPSCRAELTATLTGGEIEMITPSVFRWTFTAEQMRRLRAGTYDVGVVITFPTEIQQLIIGTLPVREGHIR